MTEFDKATLDNTKGDSTDVLTQGLMENLGEAITTPDFLTAGFYPVSSMEGVYYVDAEVNEAGAVRVHVRVADWALQKYADEVKEQEELLAKGAEGIIYTIPPWDMAKYQVDGTVEPWMTELEAEKAIYKVAPHHWIDKSKAPT